MNNDTVRKATGRSFTQWFEVIESAGISSAPHKTIAEYLAALDGVSFWWAQSITVEYEKAVGRRVKGQTASGDFQVGVSKTLPVSTEVLWAFLESEKGLALLLSGGNSVDSPAGSGVLDSLMSLDGSTGDGLRVYTTTFHEGSHLRLQYTEPGWAAHSILQIRVRAAATGKTTLSFHQEKLPDMSARETMKTRWKTLASRLSEEFPS